MMITTVLYEAFPAGAHTEYLHVEGGIQKLKLGGHT